MKYLNGFNYATYLKRHFMVGQIDPWRCTDEGKPILALLEPVDTAIAECSAWSGQDISRTEFLKHLKDYDILVFRSMDEFQKVKEKLRTEEKKVKVEKKNNKKELSPERLKALQAHAALIREKQKASIPQKALVEV